MKHLFWNAYVLYWWSGLAAAIKYLYVCHRIRVIHHKISIQLWMKSNERGVKRFMIALQKLARED